MAVLIRSERVERKIRDVSARTGWNLTYVVERAVDLLAATLSTSEMRRTDHEGIAGPQAQIAPPGKSTDDGTE